MNWFAKGDQKTIDRLTQISVLDSTRHCAQNPLNEHKRLVSPVVTICRSIILVMAGVWLLTLRQSAMSFLWTILVLCCLGALVAVALGLLFKWSPVWRLTSVLVAIALVLAVAIALLDRLGFGG